jgi:hypothetical protein
MYFGLISSTLRLRVVISGALPRFFAEFILKSPLKELHLLILFTKK